MLFFYNRFLKRGILHTVINTCALPRVSCLFLFFVVCFVFVFVLLLLLLFVFVFVLLLFVLFLFLLLFSFFCFDVSKMSLATKICLTDRTLGSSRFCVQVTKEMHVNYNHFYVTDCFMSGVNFR